jgi:hypothetical protein
MKLPEWIAEPLLKNLDMLHKREYFFWQRRKIFVLFVTLCERSSLKPRVLHHQEGFSQSSQRAQRTQKEEFQLCIIYGAPTKILQRYGDRSRAVRVANLQL